jgi:Ca2+-binding RTX toxin-like protein
MGWRVLIATVVLAGLSAQAQAAEVHTVTTRVCPWDDCEVRIAAHYTAARVEENDLSVDFDGGETVFRDRVPIAAGRGCTARADGSVACVATETRADLGDGDDSGRGRLLLSGNPAIRIAGGTGSDVLSGGGTLSGGPGDDLLTGQTLDGGDGADVLTGIGAYDRLVGGPGPDVLHGGDGADSLTGDGAGAPPAPDVLDGGEGDRDTVSYHDSDAPVRVDLAAGSGGDGDRLVGLEHVIGGYGDDVLIGDDGPNRIYGGPGWNTIAGRGGNDGLTTAGPGALDGGDGDDYVQGGRRDDLLMGGPGYDTLEGGPGVDDYSAGAEADTIYLDGGNAEESVACGPGRDLVGSSRLALLLPGCELAGASRAYPRAGPGGRLTFTLANAGSWRDGRVELRVRGRTGRFAVAHFSGTGRRTVRVRIRVPPRIRHLRRSPLPVEVRVLVRDEDPRLGVHRMRWVIDLPR